MSRGSAEMPCARCLRGAKVGLRGTRTLLYLSSCRDSSWMRSSRSSNSCSRRRIDSSRSRNSFCSSTTLAMPSQCVCIRLDIGATWPCVRFTRRGRPGRRRAMLASTTYVALSLSLSLSLSNERRSPRWRRSSGDWRAPSVASRTVRRWIVQAHSPTAGQCSVT